MNTQKYLWARSRSGDSPMVDIGATSELQSLLETCAGIIVAKTTDIKIGDPILTCELDSGLLVLKSPVDMAAFDVSPIIFNCPNLIQETTVLLTGVLAYAMPGV